ncbi:DUF7410 domain-containing protein [Halorarius litoreus]|uniref:DUF7410 domain-containing protein n=1 Tax=Halorarius litoreus TaxID=2962676 RepID=UPI0020CE1DB5|nr:hypothetical protein [Halorarius litoreus]
MHQPVTPETVVPADETPVARCPYCERPFRSQRAHDLHVGEDHADRCTDAEAEAYDAAWDDETDELFGFHMKVFVAIGVLHTVIVLAYMVVFGGGVA